MSDAFRDFPFYVETCHYLPNETNNKQTNTQRTVLNLVLTFHTRCSTMS